MPKDFARPNTKGRKSQRAIKRNKKTVSPKARVLFHGPSFSFGAIIGAAVIIAAIYAPDWLAQNTEQTATPNEPTTSQPNVVYDFPRLLEETEVKADPSAYPVPEQIASKPQNYTIQAASFKQADDANSLRARLILADLPATMDSREVDHQTWYRVSVGPFDNKTLADRAMTQLREMNLQPIWMN